MPESKSQEQAREKIAEFLNTRHGRGALWERVKPSRRRFWYEEADMILGIFYALGYQKVSKPKHIRGGQQVNNPTASCGALQEREPPRPRSRTEPLSSRQQADGYPAEERMKLALHDSNLKSSYRCPDCDKYVSGMTSTHPWRLYCSECKQELQNPDHPEYYPKSSNLPQEQPENYLLKDEEIQEILSILGLGRINLQPFIEVRDAQHTKSEPLIRANERAKAQAEIDKWKFLQKEAVNVYNERKQEAQAVVRELTEALGKARIFLTDYYCLLEAVDLALSKGRAFLEEKR